MLQDVLQSESNIAENCSQSCIFVQSIPKRDRGVSAPIKISNIQAKKPFSRGIRECLTRFSLDPAHCALVGDQIYTDVLGANCAGVQSILISAIHNHTIWLKLRHVAELPFIAIGTWRIQHEKH